MKFWRLPLDAEAHTLPQGEVCIIENRCKGCGFCIEFCPRGCLKVSSRFNAKGYHPPELIFQAEDCVNCGLCSLICPEFAIYSKSKDGKKVSRKDIDAASDGKVRKERSDD